MVTSSITVPDGQQEDPGLGFSIVTSRYLLLTFIPYFVDRSGGVWLEVTWHRDLVRHTVYLKQLTLFAPREEWRSDVPNLVRIDDAVAARIRFAALPSQSTALIALLNIPRTVWVMTREILKSRIVHSGIAGWPFPIGWIANPIALALRRHLIVVIESAPWRIKTSGRHSWKRRAMAWLGEHLGSYYARRASLVLATNSSYVTTLCGARARGVSFVNPATWIDEQDVVGESDAHAGWRRKTQDREGPSVLFAGRLTREKGVGVLLEAIDRLRQASSSVRVFVIGDGPMRAECEAAAERSKGMMTLMDPVPYGSEFLRLLGRHCALVAPSLSDEQPRIIFDAFSQALPVIAARTDGMKDHVTDETGWTCEVGSAESLASTIMRATGDLEEMARKGMTARSVALRMTHHEMHRERSHVLHRLFEDPATTNRPPLPQQDK